MTTRTDMDPVYEVPDPRLRAFHWLDTTPTSINVPLELLAQRNFGKGFFPLWNPYNGCGAPAMANYQSAFLYPLKVLLYFLPVLKVYSLYLILRLYITGILTYAFARRLETSRWGALLAATCFMLCGFNVASMQYHVDPIYLFPLLLLAFHRLARNPDWPSTLLAALAVALNMASGHPELSYVAVLGASLYSIFDLASLQLRGKQLVSRLGRLAAAGTLALLLTAVLTLPFLEFVRNGYTYKASPEHMQSWKSFFGFGLRAISDTLIAHYLSPWMSFLSYRYLHNPMDYYAYTGMGVLVLGLFALFTKPVRIPLLTLLCAGLGMGWNLPPFNLLNKLPLCGFLFPYYCLPLISFALCLLAGIGLDKLCDNIRERKRTLTVIGLVLVALALGFVFYFGHAPGTADVRQENFVRLATTIILILFFTLVPLMFSQTLPQKRNILAAVILALCFFDLYQNGVWLNRVESTETYPETPPIKFLTADHDVFRVAGPDQVLLPNSGAVHGIQQLEIVDALFISRTWALFRPETLTHKDFFEIYPRLERRIQDALNVKYFLCRKETTFDASGMDVAYEDDAVRIFHNPDVFPRAYLVRKVVAASSPEEALKLLRSNELPLRQIAVVEPATLAAGDMKAKLASLQNGPLEELTAAEITKYCPREVVIRTEAPWSGLLVLSDSFYPGWQAFVDGHETSIYPANYLGRGVCIPAGNHTVRFVYTPFSFRLGAGISLATAVILVCITLWHKLRRSDIISARGT